MFYYIVIILACLPLFLLFPTRVKGRKNLPKKGRMILCCNHQSNWDVVMLATRIFRRRFRYMAKASLFKNKFIGFILRKLGGYPVQRSNTDISAIKKTLSHLQNERAVCIFPEGARLKTEDKNDLRDGAIIFALKTKSPIVPACIIKKFRIFVFNKMVIGEPFNLSEMEEFKNKKINKELIAKGREILREKMFGLYNEHAPKKDIKKAA